MRTRIVSGFRSGLLSAAPAGTPCVIRSLNDAAGAPEMRRQLEDLGFYPGEPVLVMVRGFPGGDPLAVRIGHSTFALRASEAACVVVEAIAQ